MARLELSNEEKDRLLTDLNEILAMVEKLQELETENVEPLIYINEEINVWRADDVSNQLDRQAALANAPDPDAMFFKVPKVIDLSGKI